MAFPSPCLPRCPPLALLALLAVVGAGRNLVWVDSSLKFIRFRDWILGFFLDWGAGVDLVVPQQRGLGGTRGTRAGGRPVGIWTRNQTATAATAAVCVPVRACAVTARATRDQGSVGLHDTGDHSC